MQRPLGAQISHMLKSRGVDVIFGIPGVHNQEMYRGIEEAGLTHILARHEQGAGFMADGYARATGRPGVAYVITGPGVCNILTPLGQAYSDSVPVLMLASCLDETAAQRGQLHQMLDQAGAARTVTSWSETAQTASAAYELIDRALCEFETKRPRPKAVHFPIAALQGLADAAPNAVAALEHDTAVPQSIIQDIAERIKSANKPLFIFGGGAKGGPAQVVVSHSGAASFTTYAGRGLIADGGLHFGAYLARPTSAEVIGSADLVIAIGTELSEVDLWRNRLGHSASLVRVDIDPEVLSDHHRAEVQIKADAPAFLAALSAHLEDHQPQTLWREADIASQKHRWREEVGQNYPHVLPVMDALRAVMPDDAMIFSDMTQFAYAAKEVWPMPKPGNWHHPSGFGTLGYALPAAIGGALGRSGLPTLAIAGDYGLQYTLPELGVAVELGLSLPILIWDNGKLGAIEDSMISAQIAPNSVIQRNPDFMALAKAYGANAVTPDTLDALQAELRNAFDASAPTLIRMTPDLVK